MKRTTIYLDPSLEVRLKMEGLRRKQPMAELVREAVEVYLAGGTSSGPPGAGAFASGRDDTASDPDAALVDTGFGDVTRKDVARHGRSDKSNAPRSRPRRKRGA
jgi:hypothetical protein